LELFAVLRLKTRLLAAAGTARTLTRVEAKGRALENFILVVLFVLVGGEERLVKALSD
jgi:hypothetical protein